MMDFVTADLHKALKKLNSLESALGALIAFAVLAPFFGFNGLLLAVWLGPVFGVLIEGAVAWNKKRLRRKALRKWALYLYCGTRSMKLEDGDAMRTAVSSIWLRYQSGAPLKQVRRELGHMSQVIATRQTEYAVAIDRGDYAPSHLAAIEDHHARAFQMDLLATGLLNKRQTGKILRQLDSGPTVTSMRSIGAS